MFSIYTYLQEKYSVTAISTNTIQQDCRVTFSGSSGSSSSRRKSQSIYCTCNHTYVFFFSFFCYQAKGKYEDEAQLAQFLCFIPTYCQEIYRVTGTAPDIGGQQKPTYHSSGRSFFFGSSGSSSKSNRNLPAYRRNPIFLSFLSFSIINQPPTMRVNF